MTTLLSEKMDTEKTDGQKTKNLVALAIILAGLFVGSLFVDFAQLLTGRGFSKTAVKKYDLLQTKNKTWVAYTDPKVTVQIVTNKNCAACDPSEALVWLRRVIPTLETIPIEDDSNSGKFLIERFGIVSLPAFIFSGSVSETDFYSQVSDLFSAEGGKYFFNMGKIGLPAGRYIKMPRVGDDEIMIGNKNAKVKIITYSDFQCVYCKSFYNDLSQIIKTKEYTDKILLVFKHLPLPLHNQAENAALAALCSNKQEKFQAYADNLFTRQNEWSQREGVQKFKDYAWRFGLNGREFAKCLDTKEYQSKLDADKKEAAVFSVSGTPATFVNETFLSGAVDTEVLKQVIDAELAKFLLLN